MENEIHKDVYIQVQTKYFSYRYVNEMIYSKRTLDTSMQATQLVPDTLVQSMHKSSQSTSLVILLGDLEG